MRHFQFVDTFEHCYGPEPRPVRPLRFTVGIFRLYRVTLAFITNRLAIERLLETGG